MSDLPSPSASWRNFWESDLPMLQRLRIAAKNNLIKARTRSNCCGNHGEPGC
jgi:hypothetical protein